MMSTLGLGVATPSYSVSASTTKQSAPASAACAESWASASGLAP